MQWLDRAAAGLGQEHVEVRRTELEQGPNAAYPYWDRGIAFEPRFLVPDSL